MPLEDQFLKAKIFIVDDQEISIRLLEGILRKAGYQNIISTTDSRQAKEIYLKYQPDLVVLDLNMPYLDGFQVMEQFKELEPDNYLPVLVISNEENKEMRFLALETGAKDFVDKPYDRVDVTIRIHNLLEVRMLHNEVRDQNKILEARVKERTKELYETQIDVIQRLARAVECRDSETGMHIVRMSNYAACLAKQAGLSAKECDVILTASPLHDIGKIGIPDNILLKPGKLTAEEWEVMKNHTILGGELLAGSNSYLLNMAGEIALTHHEKWDGSGYPRGLKGEDIPMVGRICALSDVYDALTSSRPYKESWSIESTVEEIHKGSGSHFDPALVECFMSILPQFRQIGEQYADPTNNHA